MDLQNPFPLRPNVTPNTFCLIDCVYFPEKITHKRGAFRNSKNCVVTNFYYLFAMSHSFHYRAHQIKTTKINKFAFQPVSNTKLSTILQQSRVSKHCYFLLFVMSQENNKVISCPYLLPLCYVVVKPLMAWTIGACVVNAAFQALWWIMAATGDLWFVNRHQTQDSTTRKTCPPCVPWAPWGKTCLYK